MPPASPTVTSISRHTRPDIGIKRRYSGKIRLLQDLVPGNKHGDAERDPGHRAPDEIPSHSSADRADGDDRPPLRQPLGFTRRRSTDWSTRTTYRRHGETPHETGVG